MRKLAAIILLAALPAMGQTVPMASVSTVADLAQLTTGASLLGGVYVSGRLTAGDGAGGMFRYVGNVTSTNLGTKIASVGIAGSSWERVERTPIKADWFGAAGDGTTDDTSAINAAIVYANSIGGGVVELSPKTYACANVDMLSNVHLRGVPGARMLKNASTSTSYNVRAIGTTGSFTALTVDALRHTNTVTVTSATGFSVGSWGLLRDATYKYSTIGRNQQIVRLNAIAGTLFTLNERAFAQYTAASTGELAPLTPVTNFKISGIEMTNQFTAITNSGGGIMIRLSAYGTIDDCQIWGPANDGGIQVEQSRDIKISNCVISEGINNTIGGYGYGLAFYDTSENVDAIRCTTYNVRENLITDGARLCKFLNCTAVNSYDDGFNTHGGGEEACAIMGCTVISPRQIGIAVGHTSDNASARDILVQGNLVINAGTHGIFCASNSGGSAEHVNVVLKNNIIRGWGVDGTSSKRAIWCQDIDQLTVDGNYIAGPYNGNGDAVRIGFCTRTVFRNNRIMGSTVSNGLIYDTQNIGYFTDNVIQDTGGNQIQGLNSQTETWVYGNIIDDTSPTTSFGTTERVRPETMIQNLDLTTVTAPGAYPYTVTLLDYLIHVDTGSARTINLPAANTMKGRFVIVHDGAGTGAGTNNITIDANGAETIDGNLTATINTTRGTARLYCNGTAWFTF